MSGARPAPPDERSGPAQRLLLGKLERSAEVDAAMIRIWDAKDRRGHSRMVRLPPMEGPGECRVVR